MQLKVEKINDTKVRITLSFDELIERNISLPELIHDTSKVQQIFYMLFEETDLDEDFIGEDTQLLVEATTSNNDSFILTVTKVIEDVIPNLAKYDNKSTPKIYKVSSNVYSFDSIERIIDFSLKAMQDNLYIGINKIYKYNNLYFLIFKHSTVANKKFIKTFLLLSEYCDKYFNNTIFESAIIEKGASIIPNRAVQKLSKLSF